MCKKVISSFIVMGLIISASLTFADSSDAVFLGKTDTVILEKNFSELEFKGAIDLKDVQVVEISEAELEKIMKEIEGNIAKGKNIVSSGIIVAPGVGMKDTAAFKNPEKFIEHLEKEGVKLSVEEKKLIKSGQFKKLDTNKEAFIFKNTESKLIEKKAKK